MIFNLFKSNPSESNHQIQVSDDMRASAKAFIQSLLTKANFNAVVALNNDVAECVYLMIDDEYETARIIGKDGQTLSAMQTILQSYLAKQFGQFIPVFVDCNDYFALKIEKAQDKAKELEQKLSEDRPSIELFPMTSLERRAIHTMYKDSDRIATHSVGTGEDRRIVLTLSNGA
jgi:spoIIIJ-associated protein